jgi:non-ribosomal peptide synthetase component E (peptide arylation enzyme)
VGEKACAYVVPKQKQDFTFKEVVSFLKKKGVSAYKLSERLEIIDTLPMVAEGQKVDKKALEKNVVGRLKGKCKG